MDREELEKEMKMSYDELVKYLLEKYGNVSGNYFATEKCASKNTKISRTKDGLNIHHIYENVEPRLSKDTEAKKHDFKYQLAENLVYCNLLEHLLLHFKIGIENGDKDTLGLGGVQVLTSQLNDFYMQNLYSKTLENCYVILKDNFDEYKNLLRWFYNEYKSINSILEFDTLARHFIFGPDKDKVYDEIYDYMIS